MLIWPNTLRGSWKTPSCLGPTRDRSKSSHPPDDRRRRTCTRRKAGTRRVSPSPEARASRPRCVPANHDFNDNGVLCQMPALDRDLEVRQRLHELLVKLADSVPARIVFAPRLVIVARSFTERAENAFEIVVVLKPNVLLDNGDASRPPVFRIGSVYHGRSNNITVRRQLPPDNGSLRKTGTGSNFAALAKFGACTWFALLRDRTASYLPGPKYLLDNGSLRKTGTGSNFAALAKFGACTWFALLRDQSLARPTRVDSVANYRPTTACAAKQGLARISLHLRNSEPVPGLPFCVIRLPNPAARPRNRHHPTGEGRPASYHRAAERPRRKPARRPGFASWLPQQEAHDTFWRIRSISLRPTLRRERSWIRKLRP